MLGCPLNPQVFDFQQICSRAAQCKLSQSPCGVYGSFERQPEAMGPAKPPNRGSDSIREVPSSGSEGFLETVMGTCLWVKNRVNPKWEPW